MRSAGRFIILAVYLALVSPLLLPSFSAAQGLFATEPLLALPAGEESWVIHIEKRGGLVDKREHLVTIASSGQLVCGQLRGCVDRVGTEALAKVAAHISKLPPKGSDFVSVCSDCPFTVLIVRHRQPSSDVIDRIFSWTAESNPASNIARQLFEIVVLEVVP
jgi:hypothetical protein